MLSSAANKPIKLIKLSSVTVYRAAGSEWELVSEQPPVDEEFNKWADENKMTVAPGTSPVITSSSLVIQQNGDTYVQVTEILAVAVMTLDDAYAVDISARLQVAQLLASTNDTPPSVPQPEPNQAVKSDSNKRTFSMPAKPPRK